MICPQGAKLIDSRIILRLPEAQTDDLTSKALPHRAGFEGHPHPLSRRDRGSRDDPNPNSRPRHRVSSETSLSRKTLTRPQSPNQALTLGEALIMIRRREKKLEEKVR